MAWTGNSSLVVVFYVLHFFYSSEYKTNLSILRISLISCYHSCLLCKRIWILIYNGNCQINCCDQIWDLQTITCRYEENYRYLILPLRITLHQITNSYPHCGLAITKVWQRFLFTIICIYISILEAQSCNFISRCTCVLKSHLRYDNPTCEVKVADASWNPTCVMRIAPAKWRSQMRFEIPPALWKSHLRSEDRRCVLKSRSCVMRIAPAKWRSQVRFKNASAAFTSQVRFS